MDINHPNVQAQARAVYDTLKDIGAGNIPVLTVINKFDKLRGPELAEEALNNFPNAVAISALTGYGIDNLLSRVNEELFESFTPLNVELPYTQGALIALLHEQGRIDREEHVDGGVIIQGQVPGRLLAQYLPWVKTRSANSDHVEQ